VVDVSDDYLLQLLKSEDSKEKGFKELIEKYQKSLYSIIYRMAQNHHDTDDILQNTFVKIYKGIASFEGQSKLFSWMYRIAVNESNTYLKQRSRHLSKSLDITDLESQNAISDAPSAEFILKLLMKAIDRLPEKQQQVFRLRYFEAMNYKDMETMLNTSQGALKASYHHAVKKIQGFIESSNVMNI